jgi:PST family polysaccharide transporter
MIVLVRLLTPEAFGLVGMTVIFTGFANLFSSGGLGSALVQKKNLEERHLYSVFWLNLAVGLSMTGIFVLTAPFIADFYGRPILRPLTMLVGVDFTVGAFAVVQRAILRRAMHFRKLAFAQIGAVIVSGAVAIVLAIVGYGVWSLVWRTLLLTAVNMLALWGLSEWTPSFRYQWGAVRELLGFSGNLLGFQAFNYWVRNADDLLIGRLVGTVALGNYTRAYGIMLMPLRQITRVIGRVMFPALSKVQDDLARVRRLWLQANRLIGLITIPMMCGLFVVVEPFVLAIFGSKWEGVIPILQLLCLVGVKQPVGSTTGWIYRSQGRTDWQFRWGVASGIFTVIAFAIGVYWGVLGVTIAYVIRSYLVWYPAIAIPGYLIDMSFGEFLRNLSGIFACAMVMAIVVYGSSLLIPHAWSHAARLAVLVPVGVLVYVALIHTVDLHAYSEARRLISEEWESRSPLS